MITTLWRRLDQPGFDRCVLESTGDGFRLAGTALMVAEGASHEIRYTVLTDNEWNTTTVGAHVQGPNGDRRLALQCDGAGSWAVSDSPIVGLFGAVDVDLSWTPATKTLPIRRLQLDVGTSDEVTVAHVEFPGHDVSRRNQIYMRTGELTYRYESDGFEAELFVGPGGLVDRYGDLWETVVATV